jgi:hypothetical protein
MPPIQFEQIDAEISDTQAREPEAPAAKKSNPAELVEQALREIAAMEARTRRLVAD